MKIIYRYILRELFYYFFVILFLFCVIFVAYQIYDTKDEILDEGPSIVYVIQYIFLVIPAEIAEIIPLIVMFAVLFSMGMLAKNKEILAMIAMGVNFNTLAIPVGIFGAIAGAAAFYLAAELAPASRYYAQFLYEVRIKGENQYAFTGNDELFRKGEGQRFYIMANFDREKNVMTEPTIFVKNEEGSGLEERLEADRATHIESNEEGAELWSFEGLQRWTFDPDGSYEYTRYDQPQTIELEEKLGSFLSREKDPEEMTVGELGDYAVVLDRQGGGPRLPVYLTAYHYVYTVPITCLLLGLVGFATAVDLKTRNFVLAFSIGLAFGLGYYALRTALNGMGGRGLLPSIWAAWAPCLLFALISFGQLRRLQRVH